MRKDKRTLKLNWKQYISEVNIQERYLFEFKKHKLITKNKNILNVGAGRGGLSTKLILEGYKVDSLEYFNKYCEIIKKLFDYYKVKGQIINKGIENYSSNKKYDFISLVEVIEHVQNPEKTLESIHKLLKDDGKIYITIPNRYHLRDPHYKEYFICWMPLKLADYILEKRQALRKTRKAGTWRLSEMHYYTYNKFVKLAKSKKFNIIDLRKKEIYNPEYIHKSQKGFKRVAIKLKQFKMSWLGLIIVRMFFGHKLLLTKNKENR